MAGEPVKGFVTRKVDALLVYLVCTQRAHAREMLADLLWDDLPQTKALTNLRVVLTSLRKHLASHVTITRDTVTLNPEAKVWVDTSVFEEHLAAHQEQDILQNGSQAKRIAHALDLYRGEFLAGFFIRGARGFNDWLIRERERLHQLAMHGLQLLVAYKLEQGEYQAGIAHAMRWVELDPLVEDAYYQLMRLLVYTGQRGAALFQYERFHEVLQSELGIDPSERIQEAYKRILAGELPAPPPPGGVIERMPRSVGACPYRGLAAFREVDAPFFFGREAFTARLVDAVQHKAIVAVILGASGSGKSSTVFAGLLPHLRKRPSWQIITFRPGNRPFQALASALLHTLEPGLSDTDLLIQAGKMRDALSDGTVPLFNVALHVLKKHAAGKRLLLVIDQFEELYTLCPDESLRRHFLDMLLSSVEEGLDHRVSPLSLLLTLRADFMGQALSHRPFADALQDGSLLLGPMNREELQAAIEKPAEMQGAAFEAGLVQRLLDDVGEEPGNLPLLEFALSLLWEQMDQGWMTHTAYEEIGRVDGALARYAEEVYDELMDAEKARARAIFVQLVQPGEGTEDTRRVAIRQDFSKEVWGLIQHLADKRLVVTGRNEAGQETAEVVHEALIASWQRLKVWMDADRAFRTWQEGLRVAIRSWEDSEQDVGALLRGGPLVTAEEWLDERGHELSTAEGSFIKASVDMRTQVQERRERRRRRTVIGLATGLVIALVLALVAGQQWRRADVAGEYAIAERAMAQTAQSLEEEQRVTAQANAAAASTAKALEAEQRVTAQANAAAAATARAEEELAKEDALVQASIGLAAQALLELEGTNPELVVPLALEALENYPYTWQAERALGMAVLENRIQSILKHKAMIISVTWSPSGDRLATASFDHTVKIWDATAGEALHTQSHEDQVRYAVWSPDGSRLLSIDFGGTTKIWDPTTGEEQFSLTGQDRLYAAEWSPTGDQIVTAGGDNTAKIWDTSTGEEKFTFAKHSASIRWVTWSPSGERLATASYDGTAMIWDTASGEHLTTLEGHSEAVTFAIWSPSGDRLVTTSNDHTAIIWDTTSWERLFTLEHKHVLNRAQWSPDGSNIFVVGNGIADLWDADNGEKIFSLLPLDFDQNTCLGGFSPSGEHVAAFSYDRVVRVWDTTTGEELHTLLGHDAPIPGPMQPPCATWSPSGHRLATADVGGTVIVWDISPVQLTLSGEDEWMFGTAWSPSGDRIVTTNQDSARIWDTETGEELLYFPIKTEGDDNESTGINTVIWSPDGNKILTTDEGDGWAGVQGWTAVYDAHTGYELIAIPSLGHWDSSSAWFPTGDRILLIGDDGQLEIWDVETRENLLSVNPPYALEIGSFPLGTAVSPKGDQFIVTYENGAVNVYNTKTGGEELSLSVSDTPTWGPKWSPDGRYFFTISADDPGGRKWDAVTGELLMEFKNLGGPPIWSPRGDRFLTTSFAGSIFVIDAKTGAELLKFDTGEILMSADWSPDGTRLIVGDTSGRARVYPAWQSLEELIAYAKECCVIRELTATERELFGLSPK
jgi:WD40 repeat protein/DNA-binding SARP family transcriptional activator